MRQALRPCALGRPRGIRWRGRWEGGLGWGTHVNPWLIHFNCMTKSTTKKKNLKKYEVVALARIKHRWLKWSLYFKSYEAF